MLATSGLTHDFFLYPDQFFNYQIKSKFVVCFWCGKEDNHFLNLNVVCTVSIIAIFALFFAAYELIGFRFFQASVEFGMSTEKGSLRQSLLSPFFSSLQCNYIWPVFRLFWLVDWCNLSDENLLHCFIFVHIRRNGLSVDSWRLVSLFVIYAQKSIFYLMFCIISNYVWLPGELDLVALISSLPFVDLLIDFLTHGL